MRETDQTNPGSARNRGLKFCSGDWIYFADDDVTVEEDFFSNFLRLIRERPGFDIIGGPNLTPETSTSFQNANGIALGTTLGSFHCANRYRKSHITENCDDSMLILCNLFVSRKVVSASPFPENYVCAEENFALANWRRSGALCLYSPDLSVSHARRASPNSFFRQTFKYGRGRGRLVAVGEFHWFHLVPTICLVVLIALVLGIFTFGIPWSLPASLLALYFALVTTESLRISGIRQWRRTVMVMTSIVIIHLGYALGVARGALRDHPTAEAASSENQRRVA